MTQNPYETKRHSSFRWLILLVVGLLVLIPLGGLAYWLLGTASSMTLPPQSELAWDLLRYRAADDGIWRYSNFAHARQENLPPSYPYNLDFAESASLRLDPQAIEAIFEWTGNKPKEKQHIYAFRFNRTVTLNALLTNEASVVDQDTPTIYQFSNLQGFVKHHYFVTQVDSNTLLLEPIERLNKDSQPALMKHILSHAPTNILPANIRDAFAAASGYNSIYVDPHFSSPRLPSAHFELTASKTFPDGDREQYQQYQFLDAAAALEYHEASKKDDERPRRNNRSVSKTTYWVSDRTAHERTWIPVD
jgi:hypothetical protein